MEADTVVSTGNIKYFRILDVIADYSHNICTLTFGSIRENELDIVLPVIERLVSALPGLTIFVVPRQLDLADMIEKRLAAFSSISRYSLMKTSAGLCKGIILVDTVGDLMDLYGISAAAFVGGSMAPFGGHNMIEPLFFGTPVVFGPFTENFHDIAAEIVATGAGVRVYSGDELFETIQRLLSDAELRRTMGARGKDLISSQHQVMENTVGYIEDSIKSRALSQT